MNNFITNNIFKATAIAATIGKDPDGFFTTDESVGGRPIIYMNWNDIPADVIDKLQRKELLVEPTEFEHTYRRLRGKLIEQSKGYTNARQNERVKASQTG